MMTSDLPHAARTEDWSGDVVAVTVTFNSAGVLDDFLASVVAQHGDWRLVIVDNCSTDGTRDRLTGIADPHVHVILAQSNDGFSAGTNIGIRAALDHGAQNILLLNNDTVFGPSLFTGLRNTLEQSDASAVSPLIVFDHHPDRIWYAGGHIDRRRGAHNIHEHSEEHVDVLPEQAFATTFCPACCMLFKSEVFGELGLLDEDFFVYWEDAEYCDRMFRSQAKIVVDPNLTLRHKASSLTGGVSSKFYIDHYHRNRIVYLRKTGSSVSNAYSVVLIVVATLHGMLSGRDHWRVGLRRLRAIGLGVVAKLHPAPHMGP